MRVKKSKPLQSALQEEIDRHRMAQIAKHDRDAKDAAIINKHAKRLNREAANVLEYQVLPE